MSKSAQKREVLSKNQMDKMDREQLAAHLEEAQKAILKAEKDPDMTDEQREEGKERFALLLQAKNAVKKGIYWLWDGVKRAYVSAKTFVVRLFNRIKGLVSTTWIWLKGIARVVIDTVVSAFRAIGEFLGRVLARFAKGMQDVFDKAVRVFVPNQEDDEQAMEREALAELKRIDPEAAKAALAEAAA